MKRGTKEQIFAWLITLLTVGAIIAAAIFTLRAFEAQEEKEEESPKVIVYNISANVAAFYENGAPIVIEQGFSMEQICKEAL